KEVKNGLKGFLSGNPSPFPTALFFQHSAIIDSRRLPFPGTRRLFICGPPSPGFVFSCCIIFHIPILSLHGLPHSCTSQGI
ncbi:hypothetical protein, partial [Akkermansia sp.]|uniref:hypothetical protein n=1 Tax=Akkermansia sp. TaxID=1872421 RepID=UPI003AB07703